MVLDIEIRTENWQTAPYFAALLRKRVYRDGDRGKRWSRRPATASRCDRKTRTLSLTAVMESPMFGLMEPLTGADLGSRTSSLGVRDWFVGRGVERRPCIWLKEEQQRRGVEDRHQCASSRPRRCRSSAVGTSISFLPLPSTSRSLWATSPSGASSSTSKLVMLNRFMTQPPSASRSQRPCRAREGVGRRDER